MKQSVMVFIITNHDQYALSATSQIKGMVDQTI